MSKLTLSVDPSVVSRAKKYAQERGISVSRMVESYLASVSSPPGERPATPVLRSVHGILKDSVPDEYGEHLTGKYR
jgi:hypothetical protein